MNRYNLGGHSGCGIFLYESENGAAFVRKVSKDREYNDRLKEQCRKQRSFVNDCIRSPKVLNEGTNQEGLYYFDMEYIRGVTLAEYIKTIEIGKIRSLVDQLVKALVPAEKTAGTVEQSNRANAIFREKIHSLRKTLQPQSNAVINEALDMLEAHDWKNFVQTACHGDMTLENIIVRNDELYFIDFLDSFYDSWLMDVGTLLQDVLVMWSYRSSRGASMNTVMRLIVFRDLLMDKIGEVDASYTEEILYALLQKLIRIFPYGTDEQTYTFLNEKTAMVIKKIKGRADECAH